MFIIPITMKTGFHFMQSHHLISDRRKHKKHEGYLIVPAGSDICYVLVAFYLLLPITFITL